MFAIRGLLRTVGEVRRGQSRCKTKLEDSIEKESNARKKRELRQKCDELLKEIEKRKRLQSELRSRLVTLDEVIGTSEEPFQLGPEISCEIQTKAQPPQEVLNIIMVGAECEPYSKTGLISLFWSLERGMLIGGLADVMGSLPKSLSGIGHRVMVVIPRYEDYEDSNFTGVKMQYHVFGALQDVSYFHEYRNGVDFVFIDHPCYRNRGNDLYSGSRLDVAFRCALLSKAALEAPWHVPCNGVPYGDANLIYIANDWHSALVPVYLQAHYQDHGKLTYARSVFVIHNMAYQGRGPMSELDLFEIPSHYSPSFELDDPIGGEHMNLMKAALVHSHRIVAVSHGYAWECQTQEGGWGLDSILRDQSWKLCGILNGIDQSLWSPDRDPHLQSDGYANYSMESLDRKRTCKVALQRQMGLKMDPNVPMLAFIGRLDYQKGVDLIRDSYEWLMDQQIQLILLGSGRPDLESALREMEVRNPERCRAWVGFSSEMAHRITAGCDILLMPSRFEPCGLNQLYAMKYGTVPVVHAVGGLRDTVIPFDPFEDSGTGWTFDWMEKACFQDAMYNAIKTFREFPDSFRLLQQRGMAQNFGWENSALQYNEVLKAAKYQW